MMTKEEWIKQQASIELAKREFFFYCHLTAPDFYKYNREYLMYLCNELQEFLTSDVDILLINIAPRHGKSRSAQKFVEWALGQDRTLKIMTGSYNETVATQFSKGVRNTIQEEKADSNRLVYTDIFEDLRIKQGDGASNLWALEGGHANYLATSPTGTATGFGADILIIDDLIKNSEEAHNINTLDKHWEWYTNTMLSRLEGLSKQIIIMTRWHSKDLAGRILEEMPQLGYKLKHISMKALQEDDTMLCDDVLSKEEYTKKIKAIGQDIASANYQQEPIDIKGKLYSELKTYEDVPKNAYGKEVFKSIKAYCDTADEGTDYLCNIIYGQTLDDEAYILDVYYTQDPMEITEEELTKRLIKHQVNIIDIESNNGGRGFARAVEDKMRKFNTNRTKIRWFHQSKNKKARILSNATWVMEHVYFPINWKDKWQDFYKAMYEYQREGKNAHDDAQDAITGVAEKIMEGNNFGFRR